MFDRNESVNVTRKFLIALGMELQPSTNTLVDQETKSPIYFEGKIVKANNDPDKALYISDYDVKLDPLDPKCTKIVERLFGKFLDDNHSKNTFTCLSNRFCYVFLYENFPWSLRSNKSEII